MTRKESEITIVSASWHRNGVGGEGFYAIIFDDSEQGRMVASLFDESGYCAVYKLDKLAEGDIEFGSNSWRGDHYEYKLRPLVEKFREENGSNRLGPFSMPVITA